MKKKTKKTAPRNKPRKHGKLVMKYEESVKLIAAALAEKLPGNASYTEVAEIVLASIGIKAKGAK